jgi:formate-dependent nitrite reductase membrane component NrfD
MASAASALAIATALDSKSDHRTREAVHRIESAARIALAGYVYTSGPAAQPLTRGRYSRMFRLGAFACGIALPALVTAGRRKPSRASTIAAGLLSIAGALALKWSIVHAGRDSAEDGAMNRFVTQGDSNTPGWTPETSVRTGVMPA